jgi:hypothetical protein
MKVPDRCNLHANRVPFGADEDRGSNMDGLQVEETGSRRRLPSDSLPGVLADIGPHGIDRLASVARSLRCVWSSHPSHDRCCRETIPTAVVVVAWRRELERGGARGDRFFHFAWRGSAWLAYGLRDGSVRGVYCPAHSSARDARSLEPKETSPIALIA